MVRTSFPLSDTLCRSAKLPEKPYKLFGGGRFPLLIIFGDCPTMTLAVVRKKRDAARACLADGKDPVSSTLQKKRGVGVCTVEVEVEVQWALGLH